MPSPLRPRMGEDGRSDSDDIEEFPFEVSHPFLFQGRADADLPQPQAVKERIISIEQQAISKMPPNIKSSNYYRK
eukprot:Pgem_evm1s12492